jgi:hypothetical protein
MVLCASGLTRLLPKCIDHVTDTLDEVAELTAPLRATLKLQIETGRLLPWFDKVALVRVIELYTYLTGNPFILDLPSELKNKFTNEYLSRFDPRVLDDLRAVQLRSISDPQSANQWPLNGAMYVYLNRLRVPLRNAQGDIYSGRYRHWGEVFCRISDVEDHLSRQPSKLPDVTPLKLVSGTLPAYGVLSQGPKRALGEGRNEGICDVTRYYSIGRIDSSMIIQCVGDINSRTLFQKYGRTDEARKFSVKTHSDRHLYTTVLFSDGVPAPMIAKHQNRRTEAQSFVYEHRTHAEKLIENDLTDEELTDLTGPRAIVLAKLINENRLSGPVVDAFRAIQRSEGEAAAVEWLSVEAPGFHITPYGYCINSFNVDPCPKHLQCFSGCRHLVATDLPENRQSLVQIRTMTVSALTTIDARPSHSIGWANQREHGLRVLQGIDDSGHPSW